MRKQLIKAKNVLSDNHKIQAKVGPSFRTMRDQERAEMRALFDSVPPDSPIKNIILLNYITLLDGSSTELIKTYANNQLVLMGVKPPETAEEQELLKSAEKKQQENQEAQMKQYIQSEVMKNQVEFQKTQVEAEKIKAETMETIEDTREQQIKNSYLAKGQVL